MHTDPQTSALVPDLVPPLVAQEIGFPPVVVEDVADSSEGEDPEPPSAPIPPLRLPVALCDDYLLLRRSPSQKSGPSTDPRPVSISFTREQAFADLRNFSERLHALFPAEPVVPASSTQEPEPVLKRRCGRPRKYMDYQVSLPPASHSSSASFHD